MTRCDVADCPDESTTPVRSLGQEYCPLHGLKAIRVAQLVAIGLRARATARDDLKQSGIDPVDPQLQLIGDPE